MPSLPFIFFLSLQCRLFYPTTVPKELLTRSVRKKRAMADGVISKQPHIYINQRCSQQISNGKIGNAEITVIKAYVNLLRNSEESWVFQSSPLKSFFLYAGPERGSEGSLVSFDHHTGFSSSKYSWGERETCNTCKLSLHKHRRFLAGEPYKGNCHGAKIFSCDSQASCNFPNKALTLKSMSFQSLIDFHRLMKKHIVYVSGCADIQTGWDGHNSVVSEPGFQTEWTK